VAVRTTSVCLDVRTIVRPWILRSRIVIAIVSPRTVIQLFNVTTNVWRV
jgi:hypothetical protein